MIEVSDRLYDISAILTLPKNEHCHRWATLFHAVAIRAGPTFVDRGIYKVRIADDI